VSPDAVERAKKMLEDGKPRLILTTMDNAQLEIERQQRETAKRLAAAEEKRKEQLLAKSDYSLREVSMESRHVMPMARPVSRDGRMFSDRQAKVLREGGIDPRSIKWRNGLGIIAKLVMKPSAGQSRLLIKHGYNPNGMSRKAAHAIIDALAANGWRRPSEPVEAGQSARLEVAGKDV
jgi:hypothetical protein